MRGLRCELMKPDEKADQLRVELDELLRYVNPQRIEAIEKRREEIYAHITQLSAMVATLISKLKKAEEA